MQPVKLSVLVLASALAVAALSPAALARGGGIVGEVESARANARAGGPTNARDAELLDRYGDLSGTVKRDWRNGRVLNRGERYEQHNKRPR
jgi:hypothetical protein